MTRLRHIDNKTKSKVIIDVSLVKLKGNKDPYLSVQLQQLIVNGGIVESWNTKQDDIIKMISSLNNDFADFMRLNSLHFHYVANTIYNFEKLRQQVFNNPILSSTIEKNKQDIIEQIKIDFNKYAFYEVSQLLIDEIVGKLINNLKDKYYNDDNYLEWLIRNYSRYSMGRNVKLADAVENFKKNKKLYHKFSDVKTIPDNEHWTIDRFCSYSGLSVDVIKDLLIDSEYKEKLTVILKGNEELLKNKLDLLLKKYKIETTFK